MRAAGLLLLAVAAGARAASLEGAGASAAGLRFARAPRPAPEWQADLDDPRLVPLSWLTQPGQLLARMSLPGQLDRQQALMRLQLGPSLWGVGVAGDAAFKRYYLTFVQGVRLRVAPLGDLNRLREEGIEVEIEPGVVYRFRLALSWTNPLRGSTLELTPSRGTRGPAHALNTGELIDAVKARSFVFSVDQNEYWTLYGTDIEPASGLPGATRSLLFIHVAGLKTKAWALAEAALPFGQPARAQLLSPLTLTRETTALSIAR